MKVYIKNDTDYSRFSRPRDMEAIMVYLNDHGKLTVSADTVERLYYQYSDERCCGWRIVDEETLADFADWLAELDL